MDRTTRGRLAQELRERYPWVADPAFGPSAVEAGECDACGSEARLVQTCGPGSGVSLGRDCALAAGSDAWCAGHAEEANHALAWLRALPLEADAAARLWWVATGEVQIDPALELELRGRLALASGDTVGR